ncbi:MAG: 3-hydroxybutyryl-CoA dehydrogenase [Gammaproteobacteria bacterium]|nr:3-hydroxybutyryl-CoA dehydrogenase [Gammaproteobacteria bacterium]
MTAAPPTTRVAAVGAGRMGQGIALAFAYCGHSVSLVDLKPRSAEELSRLGQAAHSNLRRDLEFLASVDALAGSDVDVFLQRIRFVGEEHAAEAIAQADVLFEGVPETMEAKRVGLGAISAFAQREALIASTTSTFDANVLAGLVTYPERFANAHWLNPAHLMPLVEVSPCGATDRLQLERLVDVLESIGKVPVVCKSSPGYIVPRIQALAMNEAARMVEEGVASAEDIDTAVRVGFGLRFAVLGLLEFIDWGGGDILYYASRNLAANLDPARFAAPSIVERNMNEGRRGLRDGEGFFDYRGRDVEGYRRERLSAFVALLRHRNLMPTPQGRAAASRTSDFC